MVAVPREHPMAAEHRRRAVARVTGVTPLTEAEAREGVEILFQLLGGYEGAYAGRFGDAAQRLIRIAAVVTADNGEGGRAVLAARILTTGKHRGGFVDSERAQFAEIGLPMEAAERFLREGNV